MGEFEQKPGARHGGQDGQQKIDPVPADVLEIDTYYAVLSADAHALWPVISFRCGVTPGTSSGAGFERPATVRADASGMSLRGHGG